MSDERHAFVGANDDRRYMLEDADLPRKIQEFFDSWSHVFARREEIYDAQIHYFDHIIEAWIEGLEQRLLDESLIVVTGDHGQMLGVEGQLGHQVSLHPHGIHVPLYVFPPASWETDIAVKTPVTWVSLSTGLGGVVDGTVTGTEAFVDAVVEGSKIDGRVIVAADGPTWSVAELREQYDADAIDSVCVRKVGFVEQETMTVYESGWDESTIRERTYDFVDGSRALRD